MGSYSYQVNLLLFFYILGTKYEYELWVPQLKRFQTVTQVFKQFPEYKWNKADIILEDASKELDSMINLKSLRFTIIPDLAYSEDKLKGYLEKIEKLSTFFSKYCDETVRIRVDVEAFQKLMSEDIKENQQEHPFNTPQVINTLWLRGKNTPQPRWIYFKQSYAYPSF